MPEGDTVMWTARRLTAALAGKALTHTDFRVPRLATYDLAGRQSLPVASYGKHLFHRVDGGLTIHSHLKMEGRWGVIDAPHARAGAAASRAHAEVRRAEASHTTRCLLYTTDTLAVGTKLGVLDVIATSDEKDVTGHLGPDLLSDTWDEGGAQVAMANLREHADAPLGETLLDQRVVAGLGTFWISEMLFNHRVLPWRTVGEVPEETLWAILGDARRLMLTSGQTGIQTATGSPRDGETRRVHARSGLPCTRCNDTIRVAMAGSAGRERTLFSCPTCQGGYAPNDDRRRQQILVERPKTGKRYRG